MPLVKRNSETDIRGRYAKPCTTAFDIANHFAEWAGFECDYNLLPTRSVRRAFLREYIHSYNCHLDPPASAEEQEAEARLLYDEVDSFRGVPGFFW
jgi:ethanolamine kinase